MDTIDVTTRYTSVSINVAAKAVAASQNVQLANAIVESVEIVYAPGHSWLVGVALKVAGVTILPWNGVGSFIFGNNERLEREVGMYIPGPIAIVTNNTDTIAHGVIVIFKWHTYTPQAVVPLPAVPVIVS